MGDRDENEIESIGSLGKRIRALAIHPFLHKNAGGGGSLESQREVEDVEDPHPSPMPLPPKTGCTEVEALGSWEASPAAVVVSLLWIGRPREVGLVALKNVRVLASY